VCICNTNVTKGLKNTAVLNLCRWPVPVSVRAVNDSLLFFFPGTFIILINDFRELIKFSPVVLAQQSQGRLPVT